MQSVIYSSDTVVTQVLTPAVLSFHSQLGLSPLQTMSGQKRDMDSINLSSVYVSCLCFLSRLKNKLRLLFVKTVLNLLWYFMLRFIHWWGKQKYQVENVGVKSTIVTFAAMTFKTVSTNGNRKLFLGLERKHKHETYTLLRLCHIKFLSAHILQRGKGLVD